MVVLAVWILFVIFEHWITFYFTVALGFEFQQTLNKSEHFKNDYGLPLPIFWDGDPKNNLKIALAELQQQQHSHPTTKKGHKWSHV